MLHGLIKSKREKYDNIGKSDQVKVHIYCITIISWIWIYTALKKFKWELDFACKSDSSITK